MVVRRRIKPELLVEVFCIGRSNIGTRITRWLRCCRVGVRRILHPAVKSTMNCRHIDLLQNVSKWKWGSVVDQFSLIS